MAKPLFDKLNLEIQRGDKVAIIGANGVGKTTLIKTLTGELEPGAGTVQWGAGQTVGLYAQDYRVQVPLDDTTCVDWLMQWENGEGIQYVRGVMGQMLFRGDDGLKQTKGVVWAARRRDLLMCRLMLEKHPVLIFDEPTNHLDLEAVSALAEGLSSFAGTVLVVSHDRDLVSEVATRVLSFTDDGLLDFLGTYDDTWKRTPCRSAKQRQSISFAPTRPGTEVPGLLRQLVPL